MLFLLNGCSTRLLSQEQSEKNFAYYEEQLKATVEPFRLDISEVSYDRSEYGLYRTLSITPGEQAAITLKLTNNAGQNGRGGETVYIEYTSHGENSLDPRLFTEIVNTVSGREITESYCRQFLSDPEEKHSPLRYDIEKEDYKKIYKYEFLNWWQDWSLGYSLYDDDTEELTFWGLTKQLQQ